jgi:YkoY family integral membrane protein
VDFFHQTFAWNDAVVVGLLIILEGVLSIDNALVLGLLAKRLPKEQQRRALTYGLVGAFVFRALAIGTASFLLRWTVVKLLGGGYLAYVGIRHLFFEKKEAEEEKMVIGPDGRPILVDAATGEPISRDAAEVEISGRIPVRITSREVAARAAKFWPTVFVIELTDIAFAVDSILAAIALVGAPPAGHPTDAFHPKLWVVILGGMLGVVLMRFAAVIFIKLLDRFPRFEISAYLLVIVIGGKLLADWGLNSPEHPHRVDFHDFSHPAFWIFWLLMLACLAIGFMGKGTGAKAMGPGA